MTHHDREDTLPPLTLAWTEDAIERLRQIPFMVRKGIAYQIENYSMKKGYQEITVATMEEVKQMRSQEERNPSGTKNTASSAETSSDPIQKEKKRQFVSFAFYQIDPSWRRLSVEEREAHKVDFAKVYEGYTPSASILCRTYSTVGIRSDCDIMFWRISYQLEAIQEMTAHLLNTPLGGWLLPRRYLLGTTKMSMYADKLNPHHEQARLTIIPGRARYLFVYPFIKTREWYRLTPHTRQGIMDEHIEIGSKYTRIKINTTYSFGIDDQEFVVAFESNHLHDFVDLVQELRETEASRYTAHDTPTYTCIAHPLQTALNLLG
ncbi:chlorite dismutase family protein [Pajaroellobacter abortibovis]|uniref:Light-independent protochlorophyllide reductase subunit B-like C-terminal domain-containing protein n=1 Tax=Pajaroellobacter abortibovis TaxID=1882918 RepID=A0A1L6MX98_9BACT|nr:chlorite dismutase family protein [Pajaroellobacter abortibovis]APS00147.1 hypothetical protein BCY86_05230 [Pajaroellobacter abortibovis]